MFGVTHIFEVVVNGKFNIVLLARVDVKKGDGCGGSSSVSLAITIHSPYPLTVPARTPKI